MRLFACETGTDTWASFNGASWDELYNAPVDIGDGVANVEGTSGLFARSDHKHKVLNQIQKDGATVGTRHYINFTDDGGVSVTVTDNPGNDAVDISISSGTNSPVRVVSTTGLTFTTDFENGDTVDGITLSTGDRILIIDQTEASILNRGIYIVQASGSPVRADDMPVGASIAGRLIVVKEGTNYEDTIWLCTNDSGSDVVGTDTLTFEAYGRTRVEKDASFVGQRRSVNFTDSGGITITATDDAANNRVNIDIDGSGAGVSLSNTDPATVTGSPPGFEGFSSLASRSDHVHYHGQQTVRDLHAVVSSSGPGFYPRSQLAGTDDPDWNNDLTPSGGFGYTEGSIWVNTDEDAAFICLDDADAGAYWQCMAKPTIPGIGGADLLFAINPTDVNCTTGDFASNGWARNLAPITSTQLGVYTAPASPTDPHVGAWEFDGTATALDFAKDNTLDNVFNTSGVGATIVIWFYPRDATNFQRVISTEDSGGTVGWSVSLTNVSTANGTAEINFIIRRATTRGSWFARSEDPVIMDRWNCMILKYDSSSDTNDPEIYLNGVPTVVDEGVTPSGSISSDSAQDLRIGNRNGANEFDGFIGITAILKRMVSDEEAYRIYSATRPFYRSDTSRVIDSIALASSVTSVRLSGLRNQIDGMYRLEGRMISGAGGTNIITWEPDGVTANQHTTVTGVGSVTTLELCRFAGTDRGMIEALICPYRTAGSGTAYERFFFSRAYLTSGGAPGTEAEYQNVGTWDDTSTDFSYIDITASQASGVGAGTSLVLYAENDFEKYT